MSEHEYTPKSKAGKWFNDRLPLLTLGAHLTDYPTPKNLNYWWTFGGILTFCLLTQIVTGIVLAMHYVAHADLAFASVEHIMRDVNYGWLIRYIHSNGASMFMNIVSVIGQVLTLIIPVVQRILGAVMGLFESVMSNLDTFMPMIAALLNHFADIIIVIIDIVGVFIAIFVSLLPAIQPIISAFVNLIKVIAKGLLQVLGYLKTLIQQNEGSFKRIGLVIGTLISIVGDLARYFFSVVTIVLKFLNPALQLLIRIVAFVVTAFSGVIAMIKGVTLGISKVVEAVSNNMSPAFDRFFNKSENGFDQAVEDSTWFLELIQKITNGIIDAAIAFNKMQRGSAKAKLAITFDEEKRAQIQEDIDRYTKTIADLEDSKMTLEELQEEFDATQAKSEETASTFEFDEIEFDFDLDALEDGLAQVDIPQMEFPVEGDFSNLEVDEGVVRLQASSNLQEEADKAEQLFGSISNILAVQEVAGALLGTAAAGLNGEGAGAGMAGQPITDNSVTNSNNTAVENITINVGSDETVEIENTEATQIIASTFKKISDGMS